MSPIDLNHTTKDKYGERMWVPMCRSCSEGGRRCQASWSAEKIAKETRAANARRRQNRAVRKAFATTVGDALGDDVRRAVLEASPNHLSLIASRIADHDPQLATTIRASVNGKYPGTHNMVVQEIRAESAYLDHDRTGALKPDPMNVTAAMPALNAIDSAAIEKGMIPDNEKNALLHEVSIRQVAAELGLNGVPISSADLTADQAAFYVGLDPTDIRLLGKPNERLEDKLRGDVFRAASITMSPRAVYLTESQEFLTAEELAGTVSKTQLREGIAVAENVLLKRDADGTLFYSVDRTHRLPASPTGFVHVEVGKIPLVDEISYDQARFAAPAGQEAMFQRLCSSSHTELAVEEAAIRTVFNSDRSAGKSVKMGENFTFDEVSVPGRSAITHTEMGATGHRKPGDFDPSSPASPVANRHLRNASQARLAARRLFAKNAGVLDGLDVRHERRLSRASTGENYGGIARLRTPRRGDTDYTDTDRMVDRGLDQFLSKIKDTPIRAAKHTGHLDTAAFSSKPVSNQDVDLAVARANAFTAFGGPDLAAVDNKRIESAHAVDTCNTEMLVDHLKVREAVGSTLVSRATDATQNKHNSPVSMAAYTLIPENADTNRVYAVGSTHSPARYLALSSTARKPRGSFMQRTVRIVYTTANGAQITPQRTIIGPEQVFRVARTTTAKDGTVTVHMVEDAVLADLGK